MTATRLATAAGGGTGLEGWYDVTAATYGAVGDLTTDDTTAVQAAITAAKANGGGIVWFPPRAGYKISSSLSVLDGQNITFMGSNAGFASGRTIIRYSGGAGSGPMFKMWSTYGCLFQGLSLEYSAEAYDGNLIDFDWNGAADCTRNGFRGCGFYSTTASFGAACYVSLNAFINGWFEKCDFQRATRAVIYGNPSGRGGQYVVSTSMRDCSFARHISHPIYLRGNDTENCSWDNISAEPLTSQKCGFVEQGAGASTLYGPVFKNIWAGDASVDGGTLFKGMNTGATTGLIQGGRIADIKGTGSIGFQLKGNWTLLNFPIEGSTGSFIFADPGGSAMDLNLIGGGANTTGGIWAAGSAPTSLFASHFGGVTDARPAVPRGIRLSSSFSPNTLQLSDAGQAVGLTRGGGGVTLDIPANATTAFTVGTEIIVYNEGSASTGVATVTPAVGVTYNGPASVPTRGSGMLRLVKTATDIWFGQ